MLNFRILLMGIGLFVSIVDGSGTLFAVDREVEIKNVIKSQSTNFPRVLSLEEALCVGLCKSRELSIAKADLREAMNRAEEIRRNFFPQCMWRSLYYRIDKDRSKHFLGLVPFERTTTGVNVSQILYDDEVYSAYRAACRYYRGVQWKERAILLQTIHAIAEHFFDFCSAKFKWKIETGHLRAVDSHLTVAQDHFQQGSLDRDGLCKVEIERSRIKAQLLDIETQVVAAEATLNQLMGKERSMHWEAMTLTSEEIDQLFMGKFIEEVSQDERKKCLFIRRSVVHAHSKHPLLKAKREEILAKDLVKKQISREPYSPKLFASADYDQELGHRTATSRLYQNEPQDWTVVLGMKIPFYSGGKNRYRLEQVNAELERLRQERAKVSDELETQITVAVNRWMHAYERIQLANSAHKYAKESFDVIVHRYDLGAVGEAEWADARQHLYSTELAIDLAMVEYLRAWYDYQLAIGSYECLDEEGFQSLCKGKDHEL
ncbi:MAG: TolC family protein [Chlamydiia bacterium]|nr:TolC family protein [Chlamydiia bacterium]